MDLNNRHPFNVIPGYEQLSMLESLIPFVDFSMKLPLAIFIKFSEIRLIINCFQSRDNLIHLGLHNTSNEPLDMIAHFTGMAPEMLRMMFSMMNNGSDGTSSDILNNLAGLSGMNFPNMDFSNMDFSNTNKGDINWEDCSDSNHTDNKTSYYSHPPSAKETSHSNNTGMDTFQQNIAQILAEYDAQQDCHEEPSYSPHYAESQTYSKENQAYYFED